MAQQVQFRRGTTTEISTFTGANGEVVFDTTKKTLVLCDGVLAGGYPLPYLVSGKIPTSLIGDATTSVKGLVELATQAEVTSGISETLAVTPSSLPTAVKSYLNASGGAPVYACRAWANINGTTNAIRASGNVSSISDTGFGSYTINYTTALPSANYSLQGSLSTRGVSDSQSVLINSSVYSTTQTGLITTFGGDNSAGNFEPSILTIAVFV